MTEWLQSIKTDLLSRRLLPVLVLLGVGLIAAVAYAASGGSSTPVSPPASTATPTVGSEANALPVSVAPAKPNGAVAETPGGTRYQSRGATHNPFTPLSSPPAKTTSAGSVLRHVLNMYRGATTSSGVSSSSGTTSPAIASPQSTGTSKAQSVPVKVTRPTKPLYVASVLFGRAPVPSGKPTALTLYRNVVPVGSQPAALSELILFERFSPKKKEAVFKLVVPPILKGQARCLPSSSECKSIELAPGQIEELEYVGPTGKTVVYELILVSIDKLMLP